MSTAAQNSPAALVVGAGPTGLMMAFGLTRHGIPCRIIDKLPHASATSKALGVQSRTLEMFDQLGLIDEALALGLPARAMNIYADGQRIMRVTFDELRGPYPFVLTLPQSQTEHLLGSHLEQMGVPIERPVELIAFTQNRQTVTATLRHADGHEETVTTSWLIGCDGAHSAVRHILKVPFTGSAYPEAFALADVRLDWPLPATELHLFLQHDGIFAAFPMQGERYRLIVETAMQASDEPLPNPTLEDIQGYVNKFAPAGSVASDPAWLAPFRTHLRQVNHSRLGRVFLAGDAAHIHSPAGGQGMNTGLQDAHNLAWKLALVQQGSAPDSLLDTYESERHPVAESVLRSTDMILKMATLRSPITQQIRNRIVPLLMEQDFIQQRATAQIAELSINYRKSQIVAEHHQGPFGLVQRAAGPRAGDRAPEAAPLLRADGAPTRLFELLRAPRHALLVLAEAGAGDDAWQRLTILAETINARYGQHINTYLVAAEVNAPASAAPGVTTLLDPERALRQQYGSGESLYLIRPDGYIGYRSVPAETAALQGYLKSLFLL